MGKFEGGGQWGESVRVRKYDSTAMTGLWHLINKWINMQTFFFPDICDLTACVPFYLLQIIVLTHPKSLNKTCKAPYHFHNVINKTCNV